MKFLDQNHPMFRRAWVRWVTVLFPALWAGLEFWMGNPGFGVIFLAAAAYAYYWLIYVGPDQSS